MFKLKKNSLIWFIAISMVMLAINSEEIIKAVKDALSLCASAVIPSLFPFMVLSAMFVSNAPNNFFGFAGRIFKKLFGISAFCVPALICGLVCGYPIGAKCTCELYKAKKISASEAESLIAYSNNSGPLFVIGAVGVGMFGSAKAGIMLYAIQIFSALSCGFILKRFTIGRFSSSVTPESTQGEFTDFVCSSALNMLNICAFIVFFAVVNCLLKPLYDILPDFARLIAVCVPEVTNALVVISKGDFEKDILLSLASFALGFSGLCVHMQVKSIIKDLGLSMKKYYLSRCFIALYSMIVTYLFLHAKDDIGLFLCSHRLGFGICIFFALLLIFGKQKKRKNFSSSFD